MKFNLYSSDGSNVTETEVSNFPVLDDKKGSDALRQVVLAIRANNRQGNASTKTRDEVSGSGKKIFRQKGLGTGRAGDKRAIQRRGGGIAFGPKPRSYSQKTNVKVRKLALTRVLIDQASEGNISLIEEWKLDSHKTKGLTALLSTVQLGDTKVLVVSDEMISNLHLASRNISNVKHVLVSNVSALDLVSVDHVLCSLKAMNALVDKLSNN